MVISLPDEQYKLLKSIDFSDIKEHIHFDDQNKSVEVTDSKVDELQIIVDDEIVLKGLSDDQEEVLPLGRKLYDLYDTIYS